MTRVRIFGVKVPSLTEDAKKFARRGAQLGAVLAVICNLLPHEYRAVCSAIADVCRGAF